MINVADIRNMSQEDKLRVMEALWEDLSKNVPEPESPSWHEDALKKTEARLSEGTEKIEDWEAAKSKLRNSGQ